MRYLALCCDYDGTLATHGKVLPETVQGLERLIASGRRLVMVTGRELEDLQNVCDCLELFEYVVAENGALLYHPATRAVEPLAPPPPDEFFETLRARGVSPLSRGRVIVATWEPHEGTVLETIHALGLELQVIFNKGAVMVLPAGVNKATGLACALERMGLSAHNTVGIGDAENDHALLRSCELSVAVANALPKLKDTADVVTAGDHGAGVVEIIDGLIADDLAKYEPRLVRHHILLGTAIDDGSDVKLPPYGQNVLLIGTSGSGKSTLATGFLERLAQQKYTFCVVDPEGDYDSFAGAVVLGAPARHPAVEEVVQLLSQPDTSCIVNLVGLQIADRPAFFSSLALRLQESRARSGRPHWLLIDEAHHLLPAEWEPGALSLPDRLMGVMQISVHPDLIAPRALCEVSTLIVVGKNPRAAFRDLGRICHVPIPEIDAADLEPGRALLWHVHWGGQPPVQLNIAPSHTERRRHTRKYAEGELPPDRSFFFRGPEQKLNLRARNLIQFLQLAEGVDDDTWMHHLRNGDYSRWVRSCIKDDNLADIIRATEQDESLTPPESRGRVKEAVEAQYTLPATARAPDAPKASATEGSARKASSH
jgi:hydroxymethylpyrimidine pyrophosphatase-like HAD family hydrolase/energy-coupling factor transporter ATP-binding protein EcfA2